MFVARPFQKPEMVDEYLERIVNLFFTSKWSITMLIHNSDLWRERFAEICHNLEGSVGKTHNVSAAKHRHESMAKPRGRFCLKLDAYLLLAHEMAVSREGDVRKAANDLLNSIDEEAVVAIAMLADATDEGLLLVRQTDSEDTCPAEHPGFVKQFVAKIQLLFEQGKCVELPGYTKHVLDLLESRVRLLHCGHTTRSLGGPGARWRRQEVIDTCLCRMRAWTKLSIACITAEFPSFELLNAFVIFTLTKGSRGASMDSSALKDACARFAAVFNLDADTLVTEYEEARPIALHRFESTGCSSAEAWQYAIEGLNSKHDARNTLDSQMTRLVLRFLVYCMSTAGVEQNYSKFNRFLASRDSAAPNRQRAIC